MIKTKRGDFEIEETVCWQPPRDELVEMLSYDFSILEKAVQLRHIRGMARGEYPPLEDVLNWDDDYQNQCRIYEQIYDYARDYKKANPKR